jgi:hypothetical protein
MPAQIAPSVSTKDYAMSEPDFEAIGRHQHYKAQVSALLSNRNSIWASLGHAIDTRPSYSSYDTTYVQALNTERILTLARQLQEVNAELMEVIAQCNHWAERANQLAIRVIGMKPMI